MKKLSLILVLQLIAFTALLAQTPNQPIEVNKIKGGHSYTQDGKALTYPQLITVMQSNEEAVKQVKTAKTNGSVAMVMAGAGGFCIGWPLGTALGGGEPSWGMLGVGVVLVAIALPLAAKSDKQVKAAVDNYNLGLSTGWYYPKPTLELAPTSNGFGLVLRF